MSMPDSDRELRALFAADEPPADDALFVLTVMQRIERRTALADTVTLVAAVAMAAAFLVLSANEVAPAVESAAGLAWPGLLALAAFWLATSPWPARLLAALAGDRLAS
jgi:hypothetical protein